MVEWSDQGILLEITRFGERDLRLELFSKLHGKHAGFISHSGKSLPQIGNGVDAKWRARLQEQLGRFTITPRAEIFAHIADAPQLLILLQSALALLRHGTAEQDPMPKLFDGTERFLTELAECGRQVEPKERQNFNENQHAIESASRAYLKWEMQFLQHTGFGLDLSVCALSGVRTNLRFVSPHTGRAITAQAAEGKAWRDKLLPLPAFLNDNHSEMAEAAKSADSHHLREGFRLTEFFLQKQFLTQFNEGGLPTMRRRLMKELNL